MQYIQETTMTTMNFPDWEGRGGEKSEKVGLGPAHLVVQLDVDPARVLRPQLH